MNRALLQQAIHTIGYYAAVCGEDDQDTPAKQTIKALKAELEKPEPEPVVWMSRSDEILPTFHRTKEAASYWGDSPIPLYTKGTP